MVTNQTQMATQMTWNQTTYWEFSESEETDKESQTKKYNKMNNYDLSKETTDTIGQIVVAVAAIVTELVVDWLEDE